MIRTLAHATVLLLAGSAWAAGTSHWVSTHEADFKKGKLKNVVATNLGDLKLSRAATIVMEQDPRVSAVYAMIEASDGTIYAGTGPQGIVLQLKDGKATTVATLDDQNIFSLVIEKDGKLLVGTGGEFGRVLRLDPADAKTPPVEVFKDQKVQYVWKITQTDDGLIYAATGPSARVFEIKPNGEKSVLLESRENNILSMVSDGKENLYAGSDPNGLVYRINRKTREVFVLFDAAETEISALVMDTKGNLYAATGQAGDGEDAGAEDNSQTEKTGRPESTEGVTPLPSQKPKEPKPSPIPKPDPTDLPREKAMGLQDRPDHPLQASGGSLLLKSSHMLREFDPNAGNAEHDSPGERPAPIPAPIKEPGSRAMPGAIRRQSPQAPTPAANAVEGNAIYKIDTNGFVTEVFRQPVVILSLIEKDGILLVGTGNEGTVYEINLAADEMAAVAKLDPKQVLCLLPARDGRVMMGLANDGAIAALSNRSAPQGTYTSPVLDARQISRFGKMRLRGSLPNDTKLTIATRSGNVREPDDLGWSHWTPETPAAQYVQVTSPIARYLQYRITFTSNATGLSPVVDEVDVAYQSPNTAPQLKAIRIAGIPETEGGLSGPPANPAFIHQQTGQAISTPQGRMRQVTWEATDADKDTLTFSLYVRSGTKGKWILLQEKLKEPAYLWDTRRVADGMYQLKVLTSDVKANPIGEGKEASRISDIIVVDNTPPTIGDVKVTLNAQAVKVEARITDNLSAVSAVQYSVDSNDEWQAVSASDSIFDSMEEAVVFTVDALSAGAHQITVRAIDDHGNQAFEAIPVTVEGPAKEK